MNKVFVTGVSGFIGGHVAEYFVRQGIQTAGLVRKTSSLEQARKIGLDFKYGDITDLPSLVAATRGFDFVIHTAAYVRDWGGYEAFYSANVIGTRNVLRACAENRIRKVILTGTNAYYGEESSATIKNEESPCASHYPYFLDSWFPNQLNYYRDTKALAKKTAIEFALDKGIDLTILEPVWVYGEREFHVGFYDYVKTAQSGLPWLPGTQHNKFHVIYVRDLAKAYYLAFQKQLPGIHSFLIGNRETEFMEKIHTLFCREAGIKRPGHLPKAISYPAGFALELLYTLLRRSQPPLLTRGRVNLFYDNSEYSTDKAHEMLGFQNEYSLEEGIRKTMAWYRKNNYL
jgi:nucleoside-diphosphate-sugar epimerase